MKTLNYIQLFSKLLPPKCKISTMNILHQNTETVMKEVVHFSEIDCGQS